MRSIPPITKNLLIINVLAFAATWVLGQSSVDLNNLFGLHFFMSSEFRIYQLFTYMFMHGNLTHIFFNMFALWMFGCVIENVWGGKKFLFYYISCGVGAGIIQELVQYGHILLAGNELQTINNITLTVYQWTCLIPTVGASGAIYAILLAFGMIFPEERIFIFPLPIPIKAKWFVSFYAIVELISAFATTGDGVAHFAHLGGMLFGFLMIRYWRKNPNNNYRNGSSPVDKLKGFWEKHSNKKTETNQRSATRETDWEYNARKEEAQKEVDRILDKIRRSGYDSLTAEEKRKLFENSNKK